MASSLLSMWTMVVLSAALASMKLTAAIWLHRQKNVATWLILIGAVLGAISELVQISMLDLRGVYDPTQRWLLELTTHSHRLGDFIFIFGFVVFAARLRGEWKRIAELETILQNQHRPEPSDHQIRKANSHR